MIFKGTHCHLSEEDIEMIKVQAALRWQDNERKGHKYTAYKKKTKQEAEEDTFGAEVAFCRLFDVEPDMTIGSYLPYDAIYRGVTIDVKQMDYFSGGMHKKIKENDQNEKYPQAYVQIAGRFPFFVYNGCVRMEALILEANRVPGAQEGWASYYSLPQRYFLDLDVVVDEILGEINEKF